MHSLPAYLILLISVLVSFSDQCEKQVGTVPTQVSERKEKENVSPPAGRKNPTEKGEFMYYMSLHVH